MSLFDLFRRHKGVKIDLDKISSHSVRMRDGKEMRITDSMFAPVGVVFPDGRLFSVLSESFHNSHQTVSNKVQSLISLIEASKNLEDLKEKLKNYKCLVFKEDGTVWSA